MDTNIFCWCPDEQNHNWRRVDLLLKWLVHSSSGCLAVKEIQATHHLNIVLSVASPDVTFFPPCSLQEAARTEKKTRQINDTFVTTLLSNGAEPDLVGNGRTKARFVGAPVRQETLSADHTDEPQSWSEPHDPYSCSLEETILRMQGALFNSSSFQVCGCCFLLPLSRTLASPTDTKMKKMQIKTNDYVVDE